MHVKPNNFTTELIWLLTPQTIEGSSASYWSINSPYIISIQPLSTDHPPERNEYSIISHPLFEVESSHVWINTDSSIKQRFQVMNIMSTNKSSLFEIKVCQHQIISRQKFKTTRTSIAKHETTESLHKHRKAHNKHTEIGD